MAQYPFSSALVTGASAGIGAAIARELGRAGVPTVLVARRRDRLEELAGEFDGFEVLEADLNEPIGLDAAVARIADVGRPIDLVVNNAGFGTSGNFVDLDPARLRDEIGLNVGALTTLSSAALGAMVPRGSGYLLNVASVLAFYAGPGMAVYAATKAYVQSLTEAIHEEVRSSGVHVTSLCPGLTRTEFTEVASGGESIGKYPDFAWMEADEVARAGLEGVAKNRATVVPGMLNRSVVSLGQITPRFIARRLSGVART